MEKQLLKQLYRSTAKTLADNNQKDYDAFERADNIIIWIVGFAIGVFVLLIGKEVGDSMPIPIYIIIVISLIIIIFGLVYRILSFFTVMYMSKVYIAFTSHIEAYTNLSNIPSPRELKDEDTLKDIIAYLHEDFEYTPKKEYANLTLESQNHLRNLYADLYKSLADSNDVESQLEEYNDTISKYFGINKKHLNRNMSEQRIINRVRTYQCLLFSSYAFFFLTLGIFIIGTIYILIKFLFEIEPF